MPHELSRPIRQKIKMRNTFAKNISTDKKRIKAPMCITIQTGGSMLGLVNSLCRSGTLLSKKVVTNLAIPLAKDVLPGLVINIASNAALHVINKFERRKSGKDSLYSFRMMIWMMLLKS